MPKYTHPIIVKRHCLPIDFVETKETDADLLVLSDLEFAGYDAFSVEPKDSGGYRITVQRTRHETSTERDLRVAEEEAYMAEYEKRKAKKKTK